MSEDRDSRVGDSPLSSSAPSPSETSDSPSRESAASAESTASPEGTGRGNTSADAEPASIGGLAVHPRRAAWGALAPFFPDELATFVFATALYLHARAFDFICDDAFITFRYAKNLVTHFSPVYNLGEKVEGYTNFLWMILAAMGYAVRLEAPVIVRLLGALACATVVFAMHYAWTRFTALPRYFSLFALTAVALTAPVAAWALSGLETTLYAGLLALGLGLAGVVAGGKDRSAIAAGVVLALANLTRPEGALAFALAFGVVFVLRVAFPMGRDASLRKGGVRALGIMTASFCAIAVPFFAWRWIYYGYPFPNTFYLKTTGAGAALRERGMGYAKLFLADFGPSAVVMGLGVLAPAGGALEGESATEHRTRVGVTLAFRAYVLAIVPYIISVGGDFLGLWRFFVPVFPLALVLTLHAIVRWGKGIVRDRAPAVALVCAMVVPLYGYQQLTLGAFARKETNPDQQRAAIEPIHWTRLYGMRWGAMGRWIAAHAKPGDTMSIGAAGAMPYYAGIPSLDLMGLCDEWVARHGDIVGSRPGHQRRAPRDYLLNKRIVFLFDGDFDSDTRHPLNADPYWNSRGYVWVEAKVDREAFRAPSTFYFYFPMRADRARELTGPYVRVAPSTRM